MDFKVLAEQYRSELFDSVLPFWLKNSQDKEYGGYFSCLDRDGSVYDTDKFVWLQGIRENIIRFYKRISLTIERKIPIVIPVMPILFQEFCTLK